MNYEIVDLKEKTVVGIKTRTKNTNPKMGEIIGGLWYNFYQQGIYQSIKNKVNDKALGIYSNYENGFMGEYDITVACEVEDADGVSENLVICTIPAGTYAKFIVHGHMQQAVSEFWQELWKMNLNRAYTFDFEEYQDDCMDNAEIHIYISLEK